MSLRPALSLMARNNRYANAELGAAVIRLGAAGFNAPGTSFFPSIGATLNHILAIDLYYLDALEEGGVGRAAYLDFAHFADPAALVEAQQAADMRLIAFCDRLTESDLARTVPTDRGAPVPERIDALLLHLMLHDVHHRGQAHAMLAGTKVPPPQLDDFFLDHGRTEAARNALAL
ncbi:damage-inducible protein DinB [Pikeienuella piscinae]|uniref:Damage-inducible protein DinB n=1 Tax=Pikeienuella piscinae TaxID=2748098 RepID=A0A7M3T5Q8_9RHOB|nr:DinB family protein [Pikeienuella piscinae]QIE57339.1 damage-inducible protein DinB [Pikeienuella piscinae]